MTLARSVLALAAAMWLGARFASPQRPGGEPRFFPRGSVTTKLHRRFTGGSANTWTGSDAQPVAIVTVHGLPEVLALSAVSCRGFVPCRIIRGRESVLSFPPSRLWQVRVYGPRLRYAAVAVGFRASHGQEWINLRAENSSLEFQDLFGGTLGADDPVRAPTWKWSRRDGISGPIKVADGLAGVHVKGEDRLLCVEARRSGPLQPWWQVALTERPDRPVGSPER